jgi:hypothetical protein
MPGCRPLSPSSLYKSWLEDSCSYPPHQLSPRILSSPPHVSPPVSPPAAPLLAPSGASCHWCSPLRAPSSSSSHVPPARVPRSFLFLAEPTVARAPRLHPPASISPAAPSPPPDASPNLLRVVSDSPLLVFLAPTAPKPLRPLAGIGLAEPSWAAPPAETP